MQTLPQVSVCCAYYNRADHLKPMIASLLAQEGISFEVVLVNDGSTDQRVFDFLNSISDPRVKVIHQRNEGFVSAIRKAIDNSRGDYIAIQGAGDISLPGRLQEQAHILNENPSIGIVGCWRYESVSGGPLDGVRRSVQINTTYPDIGDLLVKNPFSHGEVMFRRSVYDKTGGYRPYFKFAQDRDLWLRMAPHCRAYIVPSFLYNRITFYSDGVSADRKKLALQQALSHFARQCHHDRQKYGFDFVDLYPTHAGLFRKPSRVYAKFLAKQSVQYLHGGDVETAKQFSRISMRESMTIPGVASVVAIYFFRKSPLIRRIIIWALAQMAQKSMWAAKQ